MSISLALGLQLGRGGKVGLARPANNLVAGVGDSLTVASANTGGADYDSAFLLRTINPTGLVGGYLAWATILPKTGDSAATGKFRFAGVHATGGLTTAQVKTTHVDGSDSPLNDSPKPGMVAVLTGTNDLGTVSPGGVLDTGALATWKASLKSIYTTLLAAHILPVACKLPPNGVANNQPAVTAMNTAIVQAAAEVGGLPVADLFTPCATGNNWTAGYNVDNDHPSVTGARAMGQALRDAVDSWLPSSTPNLVTTATRTGTGIIFLNGDQTTDGDADGVPNGGYTAEANGYWAQTANGTAWTLGARSGYSGQAWRWSKTSDPGDSQCQGSGAGGTVSPVLADGHLYEVGFTAEVASWSDATTRFTFDLIKVTDGSKVPFSVSIRKDSGFGSAVSRFVLFSTFRCSDYGGGTGIAPSGTYRFLLTCGGADAANLIDWYIGQVTLRDLGAGNAPTFVSVATTAAAAGTVAATKPASLQNGDLLISCVVSNGTGGSLSTSTFGGDLTDNDTGSGVAMNVSARVVDGTEGATFIARDLGGGASAIRCTILAYRPAAGTTLAIPASGNYAGQANGSGTSQATPSITPSGNAAKLVVFGGAVAGHSWTAPAGMAEQSDAGTNMTVGAFDVIQPTAAAVSETATLDTAAAAIMAIVAVVPQ